MEHDTRRFGFAIALLVTAAACESSSALLILCNEALPAALVHVLAAASAALASYSITRIRSSKRAAIEAALCVGALVACAPLIGMVVAATVIAPAWQRASKDKAPTWIELPMHARALIGAASSELRAHVTRPGIRPRKHSRSWQALVPIREVLEGKSSATERIQAVMTLRRMPARDALPLLRRALTDVSEDVRLLAYAILERREKTLRASIERKLSELAALETGGASHVAALRELAHDHWELVHGGFVEGELAQRTLQLAAEHARAALELSAEARGSLAVLLARVELRRGETAGAARALELAARAGIAQSTLGPLLAELAFIERKFDRIPALLASAGGAQTDRPRLHAVIEHWSAPRDSRHV